MHATAVRSTNQLPPDKERARDTAQTGPPMSPGPNQSEMCRSPGRLAAHLRLTAYAAASD